MSSRARLLRAIGALALGVALVYSVQRRAQSQIDAHSPSARDATLPRLELVPADAPRITKVELALPASDDAPAQHVTLEQRAHGWRITAPIDAAASGPKVEALLENLTSLRLGERINQSSINDDRYGLGETSAFHVVVWRGAERASDLYFGKSSARGQLLRIAGTPGVLAIPTSGPGSYAGYLYTRPLRTWREAAIWKFDPARAVSVQIDNRWGRFSFRRQASDWSGTRIRRRADQSLTSGDKRWQRFDAARVEALLQAFASLSADEFGRPGDQSAAGLEQAERTGGVLRIELTNPDRELTVRVGNVAHGPSDWSIKDSRWATLDGGDGSLYALATWTTDWVTSDAAQFEAKAAPR
jgi:hypothetical protein